MVEFVELDQIPDGTLLSVEGWVSACGPRQRVKKGPRIAEIQEISLQPASGPLDNLVQIVLWDQEELREVDGYRLKVRNGIVEEGKIHVFRSQQIFMSTQAPQTPAPKEIDVMQRALDELKKLGDWYVRKFHQKALGTAQSADERPQKLTAEGEPQRHIKIRCPECGTEDMLAMKASFEGTQKVSLQHRGHTLILKVDQDGQIRRWEVIKAAKDP
ncbi:MAG: hypothetical protein ACFFB3_08875 [Candidatus Hodarchaeota archaeon]